MKPYTRLFGLSAGLALTAFAGTAPADTYDLVIDETTVNFTGRERTAMGVNGSIPAPTLRFKEGEEVVINVTNRLNETSSIHWHGIILPNPMDGVPGLTFDGIAPGETFTYRFKVQQSGTYWYHSHSGLQEQSGVYGPMVIEPAGREPFRFDREHVVMFSDWTDEDPHRVMAKLKIQSDYYNYNQRTVFDFFRDVSEKGWAATVADRKDWGQMRMAPTDLADISGYTYTFLVNGQPPKANWTALFKPGERVRLRLINGSAMSYFDVRIPGLKMTVVQADGQNIQPVPVDELRIAVAETYDVIVQPKEDQAYTLFAESIDRSGYARATLAPREGMEGAIPEMREPALLTMKDMGMDHSAMGGMDHSAMGHGSTEKMDHSKMDHSQGGGMAGMDHSKMDHSQGGGMEDMAMHGPDDHGVGNAGVAMMPSDRLSERGIGLDDAPHRVLVYTDLKRLTPGDYRPPEREIELHLTGNMERFMWSFDGKKYSEAAPIRFTYGERVRVTLVNDTMMNHPIHLHGMWSELDNGNGPFNPLKHTINVKPGERLSFDVTADALGNWAFHCHLLFHMDAGMFREVIVSETTAEASQ